MVVRVILLAAGLVLVIAGFQRVSAVDDCRDARKEVLNITLERQSTADAQAAAEDIIGSCRNGKELAYSSIALLRAGAVQPATTLARTAVAREPARRDAWRALGYALRKSGDAPGSAHAFEQVRKLDPLGG